MSDWTLEKEIKKLSGKNTLEKALLAIDLINEEGNFDLVSEGSAWERGGAETYIYYFKVKLSNTSNTYVLKACVAASFAQTLEKVFESWLMRRTIFEANGVSTPKLFATGDAIVLEEYIPLELTRDLILSEKDKILPQLVRYAGTLGRFGFQPINAFSDLRSRGDDVVAIDFGEDVGPPNPERNTTKSNFLALAKYLKKMEIPVNAKELETMERLYLSNNGLLFN